jgi:hypothetical protein
VDVADPEKLAALADSVPGVEVLCLNADVVGAALGRPGRYRRRNGKRLIEVNLSGVVKG